MWITCYLSVPLTLGAVFFFLLVFFFLWSGVLISIRTLDVVQGGYFIIQCQRFHFSHVLAPLCFLITKRTLVFLFWLTEFVSWSHRPRLQHVDLQDLKHFLIFNELRPIPSAPLSQHVPLTDKTRIYIEKSEHSPDFFFFLSVLLFLEMICLSLGLFALFPHFPQYLSSRLNRFAFWHLLFYTLPFLYSPPDILTCPSVTHSLGFVLPLL